MKHPINIIDFGNGKPLIFQHGLAAQSQQIFKLLQDIDMRIISMDCPGHGQSRLADRVVPSFDWYTDLLMTQLDELNIEKAIFGGLSMGSGIALNAALRYPERVIGLILHRPAWLDKPFPENLMKLKDATIFMEMENGEEAFKKTEPFKVLQTELPAAAESVLGIFSPTQQASLPRVIEAMVSDRPLLSLDQLSQITVPCLILANEDDPLHPFDLAQIIYKRIEHSVLHKITSRYLHPLKHKEEVEFHIKEFIKTIN